MCTPQHHFGQRLPRGKCRRVVNITTVHASRRRRKKERSILNGKRGKGGSGLFRETGEPRYLSRGLFLSQAYSIIMATTSEGGQTEENLWLIGDQLDVCKSPLPSQHLWLYMDVGQSIYVLFY